MESAPRIPRCPSCRREPLSLSQPDEADPDQVHGYCRLCRRYYGLALAAGDADGPGPCWKVDTGKGGMMAVRSGRA